MIKHHWLSYRREVVPPQAGEVQVEECRRAFYAGALAVWSSIMSGLSEGSEPQPTDEALLASIQAEFVEFGAELEARVKA